MSAGLRATVAFAVLLFGLTVFATPVRAQQVTTLLEFTNVWKYDQSGLDLGTAWQAADYDDANWPAGAGLLGFDDTVPYPYHLPIATPLTISSTITTYYFRTTFEFSGGVEGLSLIAYALVDDGCAIYLNGQRVGGVRAPATFNAATYFPGHGSSAREDIIEMVVLTNLTSLVQGPNLVAVEVHQSLPVSSDAVWGMKLLATQPTPLLITRDPQSRRFLTSEALMLDVEVSGGPAFYQWQRNGQNIPGATSRVLNLGPAQASNAGEYRVLVTNNLSSLISSTAMVEVYPDLVGPRLVSAVVRDIAQTNQILITFDERVQAGMTPNSSSTNIANYRITRCGTEDQVAISNAVASANQVQLRVGGPNWIIGECYRISIKNVADLRGNRIAPDSQASVSWPNYVGLAVADTQWRIHTAASLEPDVFDQNWASPDYVEGPLWTQGGGIFHYSPVSQAATCLGAPGHAIGYQIEPSLFRTTFNWPAGLHTTASFITTAAFDDGILLYLNGVEIWRSNVPAFEGRLSATNRSMSAVSNHTCVADQMITVTNLQTGLNCLAAAIVQAPAGHSDTILGLNIIATALAAESIPADPAPSLIASPASANAIRLSWTGGGYALESTTNLTENSASYPHGPWLQITNMSNPYTNALSNPTRFFRLKR